MLDPAFSRGLPAFLARDPGTNSGFMIAQYTAASLVARTRCSPTRPASTPSRPRATRRTTSRWAGPRCASCARSSPTCGGPRRRDRSPRRPGARPAGRVGVAGPGGGGRARGVRAHVPTMDDDRNVAAQIEAVDAAAARDRGRRRGGGRCAGLSARRRAVAWFGGRLATGLADVTDDPAALDAAGWWAVVVDLRGRADLRPLRRRTRGRRCRPHVARAAAGRLDLVARPGRLRGRGRARPRARSPRARSTRPTCAGCCPRRCPADADLVGLAAPAGRGQPRAVRRRRPAARRTDVARRDRLAGAVPARGTATWSSPGPIKGTGRTAGGPAADKDRAENVMIVDLVRNDLGRGRGHRLGRRCPPLCAVEEHPGLVHLVSTVRGPAARRTSAGRSCSPATFPPGLGHRGARSPARCGSIGELEPVPRGPYCGAVGWVDADRREARSPSASARSGLDRTGTLQLRHRRGHHLGLGPAARVGRDRAQGALGCSARWPRDESGGPHVDQRRGWTATSSTGRHGCRCFDHGLTWATACSRRPRCVDGVPFALTRHLRPARRRRRPGSACPTPTSTCRACRRRAPSTANADAPPGRSAAHHLHRRPRPARLRPRRRGPTARGRARADASPGRRPAKSSLVPWPRNERARHCRA